MDTCQTYYFLFCEQLLMWIILETVALLLTNKQILISLPMSQNFNELGGQLAFQYMESMDTARSTGK